MRTFNFDIQSVDCLQTNENYADIIVRATWVYTITDENSNTYSVENSTNFDFDENNTEEFIPFEALTSSKVIEWLEAKLDMDDLQSYLDTQLDKLINPPIIKRELLN